MSIIKQVFLKKSRNYKNAVKIKPKGLIIHSVGCNQPDAQVFLKTFDNPDLEKGVHGFIDNTDTLYQTLPFDYKAWHCGGSGNNSYIGIELTEPATIEYKKNSNKFTDKDPKKSKAHVKATYDTAVHIFAKLCVQYNLDPSKDGVILSHKEGHKRGIASNHGDPEHLWKQYGYTMDGFRKAVKKERDALLKGANASNNAPSTSNVPYRVKITADALNVRGGAGTSYSINAVVKQGEVYTIVEEKNGWGRLKSGAGWISLKYTKKC